MAHTGDVATETVEAVRFGFMSPDEVRRLSVVKVTSPISIDPMNRPNPFGLYDPAFGPMDERRRDMQRPRCRTCGQQELDCHGHCGHIDLVYPVYHPLMFTFLYNILQAICFFCLHFRAGRDEVERCVSLLRLIGKGDVVRARDLNFDSASEVPLSTDSEGSHEPCSTVHSVDKGHVLEHPKPQRWTSLQLTEAMSVINKFLKGKQKKCNKCQAKNPKITKPTFGWLFVGMPSSYARENAISGCTIMQSISDGSEISENDTIYPDSAGSENGGKRGCKKDRIHVSSEFTKWTSSPRVLLPSEVKNIVIQLWENEFELCSFISDIQQHGFAGKLGHNIFFLETILVPPIKFRPPTKGGDAVMEHPQTVLLTKVLESNISLGNVCANNTVQSNAVVNRWRDLQFSVNMLFDSKTASGQGRKEVASGICQLLEKKEGLFRQKMMGKRVNFACRSVISPDPYLAVNEIGIPPYFATCLTYPEKVTSWNIVKLREAILNGPDSHPGARKYMDKMGTTILSTRKKDRLPISRRLHSSRGAQMETGEYYGNEGKVVLRHLRDGDVVLVNRQPTLHKPSMMAHIVRVLKGEKTIRMHYANCSTYNADFDGDEMNVHFPQDEISRAEAYNIANANNQYVRPSNGEPLRSLIQDHIISAVLLSVKDTFLTRNEFSQLLYGSGVSNFGSSSFTGKLGQRVLMSSSREEMSPILPAIWKPIPLWTGKQVITAILNHITRGRKPFTVEKATKVPRDFFQCRPGEKGRRERGLSNKEAGLENKGAEVESQLVEFEEDKLMIYNNEFVRGVIDKAQFADYGLVHTVQELYGSDTAGVLLSVLSRLFTIYLQMHGFTCGVDDLLIQKDKDIARARQLENCERKVAGAYHKYFGGDESKIEPTELQLKIEKTLRCGGEAAVASLDGSMISVLNENSSGGILSELLSVGLVKPSGKNCISLMTTTGAKGSKVNFQQISSHLGQQELEGKRVPRMVSGKTLPCFLPWDWAARAGGFVSDRFLSGLRPQEYYFHCMAGREGLVDTAVKTSRSGYLQRCLIKNLECLKVSYDHTVRDADGSIVQFRYGEDGVDVHQTSFIKKFDTLEANARIFSEKIRRQLLEVEDVISEKGSDWLEGAKDLIPKIRLPRLAEANGFIEKLPQALQNKALKYIKDKKKVKVRPSFIIEPDDFVELVKYKFFSSLAQPGEPVGVLAGQSVGEPSTQMTLNTFHLAGRGEMNVTLGIPRLQEILMLASNDIKTPVMTCPIHEGKTNKLHAFLKQQKDMIQKKHEGGAPMMRTLMAEKSSFTNPFTWNDALQLADKMKKITVADLIGSMEVSVEPFAVHNNEICSIYKLIMTLQKCEGHPKYSGVTEKDWRHVLEVVFLRELEDAIQNHLVLLSRISGIKNFATDSQPKASGETDNDVPGSISNGDENDEDDDADNDDKAEDFGSDAKRMRKEATDEVDYDDDDSSEDEQPEGASPGDLDFEGQQPSDEDGVIDHDEDASDKKKDELNRYSSNVKNTSESDMKKGTTKVQDKSKKRQKFVSKETDRAIHVASRKLRSNEKSGLHFEVHFKFTDEPHILLAQIAQTTAKKVCIQNSGKVDKCRTTDCSEGQVIYYGPDPKDRKELSVDVKKNMPALHTSGVDFPTFWRLQDQLDVRYLYSNNIHAMLNTYGVEAARETIIREISHVFNSYGIAVNSRHLSLIADFMTNSGGYRPMSRLGGISDSISPFSKMTFETASKFIVEAAKFGQTDNLETPSARICLGLPVKMGTGSFDLVQKLEID